MVSPNKNNGQAGVWRSSTCRDQTRFLAFKFPVETVFSLGKSWAWVVSCNLIFCNFYDAIHKPARDNFLGLWHHLKPWSQAFVVNGKCWRSIPSIWVPVDPVRPLCQFAFQHSHLCDSICSISHKGIGKNILKIVTPHILVYSGTWALDFNVYHHFLGPYPNMAPRSRPWTLGMRWGDVALEKTYGSTGAEIARTPGWFAAVHRIQGLARLSGGRCFGFGEPEKT